MCAGADTVACCQQQPCVMTALIYMLFRTPRVEEVLTRWLPADALYACPVCFAPCSGAPPSLVCSVPASLMARLLSTMCWTAPGQGTPAQIMAWHTQVGRRTGGVQHQGSCGEAANASRCSLALCAEW